MPICHETGIKMAIHQDDPPWDIFGIPRLLVDKEAIGHLLSMVDDPIIVCACALARWGQTAKMMCRILSAVIVTELPLRISETSNIFRTGISQRLPTATVTVTWGFWKSCVRIMTADMTAISVLTTAGISGESSAGRGMDCMTGRLASCICGAAGICWKMRRKERLRIDINN